ncbi:MAG: ATP-binding cassette domain-containing protein [bacterium]|nr:ATP-binding cassette domain-containing protein [bacterium]
MALSLGSFRLGPLGFELEAGQAALLTGPNGSGKTTLLRILAGLIRPSQGQSTLNHIDVRDRNAAHSIALVEDSRTDLPDNLTPNEIWRFLDRVNKKQAASGPRKASDVAVNIAGSLGVPDFNKAVNRLSHGNYRKIQIATWLARMPSLILLDEPHNGLDRNSRIVTRDIVNSHRNEHGSIVIVASHHGSFLEWDDTHLRLDGGSLA